MSCTYYSEFHFLLPPFRLSSVPVVSPSSIFFIMSFSVPCAIIVLIPCFDASSDASSFDDMPPLPSFEVVGFMHACIFVSMVSMKFIVSSFSMFL